MIIIDEVGNVALLEPGVCTFQWISPANQIQIQSLV